MNNIIFIKESEGNRIIISGSCYGVLYLPQNVFWSNNELHLLSSKWSSIIIDSEIIGVNSMIIASNNEASIIFRSKLKASTLELAITDNAYIEFKEIADADYVSMITLEGSQIYIPSLAQCKTIDLEARNHSLIEVANVIEANDVHLTITHFSVIRIPHITNTQKLTYKRDKNTQLLLPNTYKNNHLFQDIIAFL